MSNLQIRRLAVSISLIAYMLAGCNQGSGDDGQGETPTTLKVMFWDERAFMSQYGMLFYALYPNIEVEVVSTQSVRPGPEDDYREVMAKFIEEQQPDVLMLDSQQYEQFAADGKLVPLTPYIAKDKFDLEGLIPGMVDYLTEKAGGELYGLTPEFSGQAVFYNKDLFDRYNIEYPKDKMSWEELLNLAARFPTDGTEEDRVYGLNIGYRTDLFQLGNLIGTTLGLRFLNPANKQVTVSSDSWENVYELALKALKSGTLYTRDPSMPVEGSTYEEYLLSNPFIGGRAAMTIEGTYLLSQIREAAKAVPDKAVKNWDLVTFPVDPANPDFTNGMSFYNIFAINAASANKDAAWTFIQYIHSDDFARVTSKVLSGNLPVRTKYLKDDEGRHIEAFYALKPSSFDPYEGFDKLPRDFLMQFQTIRMEELRAVESETKSVSQALADMQTRLQALLNQAAANDSAIPAPPAQETEAPTAESETVQAE